jgi:hypothetical protein
VQSLRNEWTMGMKWNRFGMICRNVNKQHSRHYSLPQFTNLECDYNVERVSVVASLLLHMCQRVFTTYVTCTAHQYWHFNRRRNNLNLFFHSFLRVVKTHLTMNMTGLTGWQLEGNFLMMMRVADEYNEEKLKFSRRNFQTFIFFLNGQ